MTYPGPQTRRRTLPNHTEEETLELEARRGIHAGMLPSNLGNDKLDGWSGAALQVEQSMRGWTAQQPWVHVDCPVMHLCIFCGKTLDPDYLRDHDLGGKTPCPVLVEVTA